MRQVTLPDGRTMTAYQPHELSPEPSGSSRWRKTKTELFISRLFGSWEQPGPLMLACQREAEFGRASGHRHFFTRQAN